MFWHFCALTKPFGNCRSRICDTSHVSNNPRTSSLSTTTTTPSIAMPPPRLAGTTEIHPQPLATTTAGPNTVDNNVSMTWTSAHRVDATMQHVCAASSHCHVAEIDVAMRMTNEECLLFPLFLVSAPIILLWILTGIPSVMLPDNKCGCPPTLTIDDHPHPTTHHQDLGMTWPHRCMHWPRQTRPQQQTQPWRWTQPWWTWQPNSERWCLSPFAVVDMEIRWHNKWGGHHLDLSTDYESSEVRRVDSFITPGIEESFSALTQNFAFLPRKLMARFLAQNGSD